MEVLQILLRIEKYSCLTLYNVLVANVVRYRAYDVYVVAVNLENYYNIENGFLMLFIGVMSNDTSDIGRKLHPSSPMNYAVHISWSYS